jgi:hypothetical protein
MNYAVVSRSRARLGSKLHHATPDATSSVSDASLPDGGAETAITTPILLEGDLLRQVRGDLTEDDLTFPR